MITYELNRLVSNCSSPPNITSSIHSESVRHSVALPEASASLSSVATIQSTISTKSDRPKTPPGLKSLQDHQSPGMSFAAPRDINRIATVFWHLIHSYSESYNFIYILNKGSQGAMFSGAHTGRTNRTWTEDPDA